MKYTQLLNNKSYLATTTIISIGVLSGYDYCSPLLVALLLFPVVKYLYIKTLSKPRVQIPKLDLNKKVPCK